MTALSPSFRSAFKRDGLWSLRHGTHKERGTRHILSRGDVECFVSEKLDPERTLERINELLAAAPERLLAPLRLIVCLGVPAEEVSMRASAGTIAFARPREGSAFFAPLHRGDEVPFLRPSTFYHELAHLAHPDGGVPSELRREWEKATEADIPGYREAQVEMTNYASHEIDQEEWANLVAANCVSEQHRPSLTMTRTSADGVESVHRMTTEQLYPHRTAVVRRWLGLAPICGPLPERPLIEAERVPVPA